MEMVSRKCLEYINLDTDAGKFLPLLNILTLTCNTDGQWNVFGFANSAKHSLAAINQHLSGKSEH